MRATTERRIRTLEQRLGWRRYRHRPFEQWPEAAAKALLAEAKRDPSAFHELSNTHLKVLMEALKASLAAESEGEARARRPSRRSRPAALVSRGLPW
jgi:hypothetical protein